MATSTAENMNIIVCIKQVPDTTDIKIDPDTNTLVRSDAPCIINPFDMYAIEEGLRLRQRCKGSRVTGISMGPPQAEAALREAMALGVDDCALISGQEFAGSDTLATSYTLAQGIKRLGDFDLVICGKQAADGDTAHVGPGIAEFLRLPQVTYVKQIRAVNGSTMTAVRMNHSGCDVVEVELPAVITVVKDINRPRLPTLGGKLRALRYSPEVFSAEDLNADRNKIGTAGSPTQVVKISTPTIKRNGDIYEGGPEELADILFDRLIDLEVAAR